MAQGAVKKSSKPDKTHKKSQTALGPKRGARVIAPRKVKAAEQRKLMKKHTAGLTALTEKKLAEKAGHLEMLAGGKKDSKKAGKGAGGKGKK